tara:strand:+ start:8641 stop:8781 length:141 start_codon:yes stop_codon:yes gene_type:complete
MPGFSVILIKKLADYRWWMINFHHLVVGLFPLRQQNLSYGAEIIPF